MCIAGHQGIATAAEPNHQSWPMTHRVLFLCTGNSARSILAEATLRAWAGDRFEAFSAGSQPAGKVNPYALGQLQAEGMPTVGMRSKSWDEFTSQASAPMDLVITVCDSAAAEACPIVFGNFIRTHWGMPDPAAIDGTEDAKREAFRQAHHIIKARLQALLALPPEVWGDRSVLKPALDRIGLMAPDGEAASHAPVPARPKA